VLAFGTYYLAVIIPKGFLPSEDINQINGSPKPLRASHFDAMLEHEKTDRQDIDTGSGSLT